MTHIVTVNYYLVVILQISKTIIPTTFAIVLLICLVESLSVTFF